MGMGKPVETHLTEVKSLLRPRKNRCRHFTPWTAESAALVGEAGRRGLEGEGGLVVHACTDNHGHQEISLKDGNVGRPGLPGYAGHNGRPGRDGAAGHYQLKIVPNFDPIVATLNRLPNDQIHSALRGAVVRQPTGRLL